MRALGADWTPESALAFQSLPLFAASGSLAEVVASLLRDMALPQESSTLWQGIADPSGCKVTAVDALFAFVEEVRAVCSTCGRVQMHHHPLFLSFLCFFTFGGR